MGNKKIQIHSMGPNKFNGQASTQNRAPCASSARLCYPFLCVFYFYPQFLFYPDRAPCVARVPAFVIIWVILILHPPCMCKFSLVLFFG